MRPFLLAVLVLASGLAAASAPAPARIAILDSGIAAGHAEFAPGQVVAWRDFVNGGAQPYDDQGHGTATAALAAGGNVEDCALSPKLSFAPGAPLIVGKVLNSNNGLVNRSTLALAIDWAVLQGADVVSISIGSSTERFAEADRGVVQAVERANAAGVLVLVSAGNGGNFATGLPWISWGHSFGNVPGVLMVGGGTYDREPVYDLQPDVTSWGFTVCTARRSGGYELRSGTSFATPLVAGMLAGAIDAAREAGQDDGAARMREVVVRSATNDVARPYAREGLGFLLEPEAALARAHAAAGTLPSYDAQGPHALAERAAHDAMMPILKREFLP